MIPINECILFESQNKVPGSEVALNKWPDFDLTEMHKHEYIEVAYVQSGAGWHVLNSQISRSSAGDVVVVDNNDAHMWMSEVGTPMTIHNLIFRPGFFDASLMGRKQLADVTGSFLMRAFGGEAYARSLSVNFAEGERPAITALYEGMLDEYTRHAPGFEELIRARTIELLVRVFRRYRDKEHITEAMPRARSEALTDVYRFLAENYASDVSLEKLSEIAYVSPKYFSRMFKDQTGFTVTGYVQKLRVAHACELLRLTRMSAQEVAARVGYSDPKFFAKVFLKVTGLTPSAYRRRPAHVGHAEIPKNAEAHDNA